MKTRLFTACTLALLLGAGIAVADIGDVEMFIKTVADIATPERITEEPKRAASITFVGMKAARVPNAGNVWIQVAGAAGGPGLKLAPGQTLSISREPGTSPRQRLDVQQFFLDVETAGDGVLIIIVE